MKFDLKIREAVEPVEIIPSEADGQAKVILRGAAHDVEFTRIDEHQIGLKVDGKAAVVFIAGQGEERHVFLNGHAFHVREKEGRGARKPRKEGADEISREVTPPMPAVVVRILVEEGSMVTKGQGLIVVSAMKMETTLKAPVNGKVVKINTALQAKVMPGDNLVEIEEGPQDG